MLVLGARAVELGFLRSATEVAVGARTVTMSTGADLLGSVKLAASHAPGPRVITGQYLSSISLERSEGAPGVFSVAVGSNHPAANRLEHGFHGADSLGRHYHQRARPHFAPAAAKVDNKFHLRLLALVQAAI